MKAFLRVAVIMGVAACGAPKHSSEHAIVPEGSATPETCCCKSTPATSEDGKPVYEMKNRMECSTAEGDCEPEVQCTPHEPAPNSSPAGN
jgi:hypothetical protein